MKIFSVAKILQKVVKYFCSEMCPRVQRIFRIFLRISRATEMRVALEVKELLGFKKYSKQYCWVGQG